jgi:hypothetical protein
MLSVAVGYRNRQSRVSLSFCIKRKVSQHLQNLGKRNSEKFFSLLFVKKRLANIHAKKNMKRSKRKLNNAKITKETRRWRKISVNDKNKRKLRKISAKVKFLFLRNTFSRGTTVNRIPVPVLLYCIITHVVEQLTINDFHLLCFMCHRLNKSQRIRYPYIICNFSAYS